MKRITSYCPNMTVVIFNYCSLSFNTVPVYCWKAADIMLHVNIEELSSKFQVSINRSGPTYPSYISQQCAMFSIIGNSSSCKLDMDTNELHTMTLLA